MVQRSEFVQWLFDWQTLIGGGAALFAALVTGGLLWWQINGEIRRHRDQQRGKRRAARVAFPEALNEFAVYADGYARLFGGADAGYVVQDPSEQAVAAIRSSIEFLEDGAAESLIAILNRYQIQRARRNNAAPPPREKIYDVADLTYLVDRVLRFAQGSDDVLSPPGHDLEGFKRAVSKTTLLAGIDGNLLTEIHLMALLRHDPRYTIVGMKPPETLCERPPAP